MPVKMVSVFIFCRVSQLARKDKLRVMSSRGSGQNKIKMSVCFAIQLGLTSQLSGLLSIPLSSLHERY